MASEITSEWKQVSAAGGHLLAGQVAVPPLSSVLDPKVPCVEVEAGRLHAALSWLYGAVQSLQQQGATLRSEVGRLEGTLREWGEMPGVAAQGSQPEDLRLLVRQQEQKRIGDRQQLEMRLDSLGVAVESRLKAADLEDLRGYLTLRADEIASTLKEEMSMLTKQLQEESANDRRQLQAKFESLRSKVDAQLELLASPAGSEQLKAAVEAAEGAANAAAGSAAAAANAAAATAGLASLGGGREDSPSLDGALPAGGAEARLCALEDAVFSQSAVSSSSRAESVAAPEAPARRQGVPELQARLDRLETSFSALRSSGIGRGASGVEDSPTAGSAGEGEASAEISRQLVELHKAQTDVHLRLLEVDGRVAGLEQGATHGEAAYPASSAQATPRQAQQGAMEQELQNQSQRLQQMGRALGVVARYISKDLADEQAAAPVEDKLAWLEERVEALVRQKGHTLESRMQKLEGLTAGSQVAEVGKRVQLLEKTVGKLDLEELRQVPPQLIIVRQDQELFKKDLRQEVQELKVLVGCIEACVPKETRKAIQLFKRAAGASEEVVVTPRGLKLEGDILSLRQDMETRLQAAEQFVATQCENITHCVRGIEKKQDRMESYLEDGQGSTRALASVSKSA